MNKKTGQRGFTLIELMIVVSILSIFIIVGIPKFAQTLRQSKEGSTKGSLSSLRSALTIYLSDNEGVAPLSLSLITGSFSTTFVDVMVPKYVLAIPSTKLGTYYGDNDSFFIRPASATWTGNRSLHTTLSPDDVGGWVYVSAREGAIWVDANRTDIKNVDITLW